MTKQRLMVLGSILLAPMVAIAQSGNGPAARFTVSTPTQVPGKTLSAGSYTIRVVDQLTDRMIVRVDGGGKPATFLALPATDMAGAKGMVALKTGVDGKAALKGFAFPNGPSAEFVYPKGEAVGLAKANDLTVPAIDPGSEGRSEKTDGLSHNDMQMVTLWMLTPTPVNPGETGPGIKAERYQKVASNDAPKPPRPKMAALPHTASEMPLVWLMGGLSLAGAAVLSRRRMAGQQA